MRPRVPAECFSVSNTPLAHVRRAGAAREAALADLVCDAGSAGRWSAHPDEQFGLLELAQHVARRKATPGHG